MRRLAALVAVLCVTGSAFADEAGNQDAATRDAAGSLALLRLPAGAERVADNPAREPQYLDSPGVGRSSSPNVVQRSEFWRVPGNPWDVFAWLKKHVPPGARIAVTGGGGNRSGQQVWSVAFERRPIREVMDARQLAVTLAKAADAGTAVRADGLATWLVPRPAAERIPGGAATLNVAIRGMKPTPVERFSVSDRRRVASAARVLNRLPLVQPGVRMCPLDRGIHARLIFRRRDGGVVADADAALGGCSHVDLTLGGQRQPQLDGWTLFDDVQAALGRRIDLTPLIGSEFVSPPQPVAPVAHGTFARVPFDAVAYDGGSRTGVCVQIFLAGVERGSGCLLHLRGMRTSSFPAPACYPHELTAVGVLGRNAAHHVVRFDDGRTIHPDVHFLPHATLTTSTGVQGGHLVKLKHPATISLGYRGPFAFGFRRGVHDLDARFGGFSGC